MRFRQWIRATLFILILLLLIGVLLLSGCAEKDPVFMPGNGLFSWHWSEIEAHGPDPMLETMQALELTELFQYIPERVASSEVRRLTQAAAKRGISVYLLTGEPDWGLDPEGTQILSEIRRAASLPGLCGVMIDVEVHLTDLWEIDSPEAVKSYISAMCLGEAEAEKAGLTLISCIPYYYDSEGFAEAIKALVSDGCDALAVMNYQKYNETEHLEREALFCEIYGKPLINIYELQPPGIHGLVERNTYYNDGLSALKESWKMLKESFPNNNFSYALHDYDSLLEVMRDE